MDIVESVERYETWLRARLKGDVNEKDLAEKHEKMAAGPFPFLRATYWRWAETILEACPELEGAPDVLAVGDIHIENFGTWRDTEGRLVWGVNDFDEAADMPYAVDVVRLAASAVLAGTTMSARRICLSILDGYHDGIRKPGPIILDREHEILRKIAVVDETGRKKFWKKFDPTLIREQIKKKKAKGERPKVQPARTMRRRYAKALREAQPDSRIMLRFYERTAGTGSLGRRRFFSVGPWRGDLVVREAKAIVCSGWALAHRGSHNLRCEQIASGRYRSPDPTYQLRGHVLVRRLSPDDFKIEVEEDEQAGGKKKKKGRKKKASGDDNPKAVALNDLVKDETLRLMGHELATIHRGTNDRRRKILVDLAARKRRNVDWLRDAVMRAKARVRDDYEAWLAAD